jgi:hypothetical protein
VPGTQSRGTGASKQGNGSRQPASPAPESVRPEAVVLAVQQGGEGGGGGKKTCRLETPSACMCSRRPALSSLSEPSVWLWDPPGWDTCVRSTREALLATSLDSSPPLARDQGHHRVKGTLNRAGLPRRLGGAFGGHQASAFEAAGGQERLPKEAGMAAKCQAKMSGERRTYAHSRGLNRPMSRSKVPPHVQAAGLGRCGGDWDSRPAKCAQHSSPALPPKCQAKIPVHKSPDIFCLAKGQRFFLHHTTVRISHNFHSSTLTTSLWLKSAGSFTCEAA